MTDQEIDALDVATLNPMEAILVLAERLGVSDLANTHDGRCWEHQVDDRWWFAVNPNRESLKCSHGPAVAFGHVYVEFNGWPAGLIDLRGQGEFAMGEAANPDTFNAAVLAAAKKAQPS